jgi:hypothetical protein
VVLFDLRLEELFAVRPEARERPRLIRLHEAAIADYVGRENRRKLALHCRLP